MCEKINFLIAESLDDRELSCYDRIIDCLELRPSNNPLWLWAYSPIFSEATYSLISP